MRRKPQSKRSVLLRRPMSCFNSEAGRNLQQQEVWKNNNIRIDGSDDKSLEEALNPRAPAAACSSDQEISLDALNAAINEERKRGLKLEYYNNLLCGCSRRQHTTILKAKPILNGFFENRPGGPRRQRRPKKNFSKCWRSIRNDGAKKMALATTT